MGEVYRARDTRLDRTVAIKVLPGALAADAQFRERFQREARVISQLSHSHICTLHDVAKRSIPSRRLVLTIAFSFSCWNISMGRRSKSG